MEGQRLIRPAAGLADEYRPSVLHVGCGPDKLPEWIGACKETRVDINPAVKPDIVASMTDLGDIGPYDSIWCCHALEHLTPMDVMKALAEFHRVLRPGGIAMIIVPDLENVKPTFDVVYESAGGPVTGHDMYYGHLSSLGNPWMQHRTGFVSSTLQGALMQAGFSKVRADRLSEFNLFGVGVK